MVAAGAGVTHAAEGQFRWKGVLDHVVDARAAGRGPVEEGVGRGGVLREHVRRQGLLPGVHEVDGCVDRLDGEDRQDRAEDLLLHDGGVGVGVDDDGRVDVA